ncbi:MAG: TIGR01777 family oxidoreductase [Pyrinomonadaceae bacterium]
MKIVIPGGSGRIGSLLTRELGKLGHEVVILSRNPLDFGTRSVIWDGKNPGHWEDEIDGAFAVINLAGKDVNCRYNDKNRREMMSSRVDSTKSVGIAIQKAANPPTLWLQMSTATIYSHRFDAPNDEFTGHIKTLESDSPLGWDYSIAIARAWEKMVDVVDTPYTRKVKMRSAMVMSPDKDGIFDTLLGLTRRFLGGSAGSGRQFVSWVHEKDFVNAILFLIEHEELDDVVNIASPNPLPNSEFMRTIREAAGIPFGLPATELMLEIGAYLMGTETELILKSRRVVPTKLQNAGFKFEFPEWKDACRNLLEEKH